MTSGRVTQTLGKAVSRLPRALRWRAQWGMTKTQPKGLGPCVLMKRRWKIRRERMERRERREKREKRERRRWWIMISLVQQHS